jgi:Zn-dependent protease
LAFICFCLLRGGFWLELGSAQGLNQFLVFMIGLNFALALFNLIPIAPLDGSLIVDSVISRNFRPTWEKLGAIGPALLLSAFLVLLYFNSELFDRLIPFD